MLVNVQKNEFEKALLENTYLLAFNTENNNHYFVNFESINELNTFIEERGIISLYNEWLDFICSDYIAEEIGSYYVGNVLKENDDHSLVEFKEIKVL